jgi:hypothetical protein
MPYALNLHFDIGTLGACPYAIIYCCVADALPTSCGPFRKKPIFGVAPDLVKQPNPRGQEELGYVVF